MRAPEKALIVESFWPREMMAAEVLGDDPIHGMIAPLLHRGKLNLPRGQRRLVGGCFEGETIFPGEILGQPVLQERYFLGRKTVTFRWHPQVLIIRRHHLDQVAGLRGRKVHDGAAFTSFQKRVPVVHGKAALLFVAGVTIGAMLAEERDDLMREVNGRRLTWCQEEDSGECENRGIRVNAGWSNGGGKGLFTRNACRCDCGRCGFSGISLWGGCRSRLCGP